MNGVVYPQEPLVEGKNFRRLSVEEGEGIYRFTLTRDVTFTHPGRVVLNRYRAVAFLDKWDREWMRMSGRDQIIRKGYSWNGNSPKFGIGQLWLGAPDFDSTIGASLKHDADFQFSSTALYPFFLGQVNEQYRQQVSAAGSPVTAAVYYGALVLFSHMLWKPAGENYSVTV